MFAAARVAETLAVYHCISKKWLQEGIALSLQHLN
jgi:hypothetical protein